MNPPGLWMIVATPVLVVAFVFVMRWATEPDPDVAKGGARDDDETPSNEAGP